MVEKRLKLEPEVQEIFKLIDNGQNFLLSGGAGSGKTYSLISTIRQIIAENPTAKVACITYTNAAVREIEGRVNHKNLYVSTIHEFIWDNIKHFQKEIKLAIVYLVNDENTPKITIGEMNTIPENYFDSINKGIEYKAFLRLQDGIISHDELLIIANFLFERYPKLSSIVKDRYNFILIDEYQDTNKLVIEIFLKHFNKSKRKNIIGFFGDAMQSIFDEGVGNLDEYKYDSTCNLNEVQKKQNRRNPRLVIDLANKLRTDGIIQEPSTDPNAPNMVAGTIKHGTIIFLHSTDNDIRKVEQYLEENHGWNFKNSKETKELNLTHNLIAEKAGFRTLMDIYDKDPIIDLKYEIIKKSKSSNKNNMIEPEDTFDAVVDKFQLRDKQRNLKKETLLADPIKAELYNQLKDKLFSEVRKIYLSKEALIDDKKQDEDDEKNRDSRRDYLIKHLFKIQNCIAFYQSREYNDFLKATDYRLKIKNIESKKKLKENIEKLINIEDNTIETVINDANDSGICLIDDDLKSFIKQQEYLYNRIKKVKFSEFQKLYEYLEGKTPFSTQHKIKGAEFDNVLVVLDNGGWNKYQFENLFLDAGSPSVLERTRKIFYVCCTRTKENLAVFYHCPDQVVIEKAKKLFGNLNVINLNR